MPRFEARIRQSEWQLRPPCAAVGHAIEGKLTIGGMTLKSGQDDLAWSALPDAQVTIPAAAMVFAGYGVVAPEHQWDEADKVLTKCPARPKSALQKCLAPEFPI